MKVTMKLRVFKSNTETKIGKVYIRVRSKLQKEIVIATGIEVFSDYWDCTIPGYKDNTPEQVIDKATRKKMTERCQQLIFCIEQNCTDETSKEAIERTISIFLQTAKEDKSTERTKNKRTKAILDKVEQSQSNNVATARLTAIDYF